MKFPFTDFDANAAWMMTVGLAADLVRWFQLLASPDPSPRPRRSAGRSWHTPGRSSASASTHRLIDGWPTSQALVDAYQRIAALT